MGSMGGVSSSPLLGVLLGLSIGAGASGGANAQIGYPGPNSNFNEQKVGVYTLPDPLKMQDGTQVRDARPGWSAGDPR